MSTGNDLEVDVIQEGPINVLLCLKPRLIRQMTRKALSAISDIRIVAACSDYDQVQDAIGKKSVDWVIVGTFSHDGPLPEDTLDLLVSNPTVSMLGIGVDGPELKTWWLSLQKETIRSPSLDDIVDVLHSGISSY